MTTLIRHVRNFSFAAFVAVTVTSTASAQLTLEVRQGTTWGNKLVLSAPATMTFRWKYDGRADINGAAWQLSYVGPNTRGDPPIVKSGGVSVSATRLSDYSTFQIAADAIPTDVRETFYVRLRSGEIYSGWTAVSITGAAPAVTIAPPPAASTVTIPDSPLWVKLTKIICKAQSADGSASDEVYVLLASVGINHEKPWTSTFLSRVTQIYEGMNANDFRSANAGLWGPPSGDPVVFRKPGDVILHYWLVEHDAGSPLMAMTMGLGGLSKMVGTFNTDWSYARMSQNAGAAYSNAAQQAFLGTGSTARDDQIGTGVLAFTQGEIDDARTGKIVKKEVLVGSGDRGVYLLRFQMGRAGTSTEAW